jgi:polyhydroxyalkanoate synthesis regulator phasin
MTTTPKKRSPARRSDKQTLGALFHEVRAQGTTLREQGEVFRGHSELLRGHSELLRGQGEMLREHGEAIHGLGGLMEDMRAQNKAVLEAVQGVEERLDRKIEALREDLSSRITSLEHAVRELGARVGTVETAVHELRVDLAQVASRAAVEALEQRVSALERRMGLATPKA